MGKQHKALGWAGWVITVLLSGMLLMSASMKLSGSATVVEQMGGIFGYPEGIEFAIGIVELGCLLLFLIPQTAVLGAILLTGYLGGAVATHLRVEEPYIPPIIVGILVWGALFLRDPRIRALIPLRKLEKNITTEDK